MLGLSSQFSKVASRGYAVTMAVSANTLFHFTDTFDKLCGILESSFKPHYCIEQWNTFFPELGSSFLPFGVPMVCFCDIPLSQIQEHVQDYGKYAIGLSKDWATRMKLGPVIYLTKGSVVSDHAIESLRNIQTDKRDRNQTEERKTDLPREVVKFAKPYKGLLTRNGKVLREKTFYSEREWRFVPDLWLQLFLYDVLPYKMMIDSSLRDQATFELGNQIQLEFEPSDIKYILISNENEILDLLTRIENVKGEKYSHNQLRILTTKIITIDKVLEDM